MSDRELLDLAAKAAGIYLWWRGGKSICNATGYWNPLNDDGDALRLAVKLRLSVNVYIDYTSVTIDFANGEHRVCFEQHGANAESATRRAIVCAAAEDGSSS